MQVEIQHARSMDEIFDAISYMKGSAIIRMLQGCLGDDMIQVKSSNYALQIKCFLQARVEYRLFQEAMAE